MPAYGETKLSDGELDLLVRWMTGDFPATTVEDYPDKLSELTAAISTQNGVAADVADSDSGDE